MKMQRHNTIIRNLFLYNMSYLKNSKTPVIFKKINTVSDKLEWSGPIHKHLLIQGNIYQLKYKRTEVQINFTLSMWDML